MCSNASRLIARLSLADRVLEIYPFDPHREPQLASCDLLEISTSRYTIYAPDSRQPYYTLRSRVISVVAFESQRDTFNNSLTFCHWNVLNFSGITGLGLDTYNQ